MQVIYFGSGLSPRCLGKNIKIWERREKILEEEKCWKSKNGGGEKIEKEIWERSWIWAAWERENLKIYKTINHVKISSQLCHVIFTL